MSKYKLNWIQKPLVQFSAKNLQNLVCLSPFVGMCIDTDGGITLCGCQDWMPSKVGNLLINSLDEILSNAGSTNIRQSIINGTYDFCNENTCGVLKSDLLNVKENVGNDIKPLLLDSSRYIMPKEIWVSGDRTCNLSCPSCRTEIIKNSDAQTEHLEHLGQTLKSNLFCTPTDRPIVLHVSTSGELFASPMLLSFVNTISTEDFPNVQLAIQSNGLLVPERWHRLESMQEKVKSITITTDAARPATYEKLRRGGRWDDLQHALLWISEKKKQNGMLFKIRMIVQKDNFEEMLEFYNMGQELGVDLVEYGRIGNWGTFSNDEFDLIDAFNPKHSQYQQAQEALDQIKNLDRVILFGGL